MLAEERPATAGVDENLTGSPSISPAGVGPAPEGLGPPFGRPRNFLNNRFVYAVISQRAHGLSIGVNLNPDKKCNFDCVYCEVNRDEPGHGRQVDLKVMSAELHDLLARVFAKQLGELEWFHNLPADLLQLKEVALSGDGEPTLCPNFTEVVREVVYIRSQGTFPFFKIVLITNTTGLHLQQVRRGLHLLTTKDEIWVKLDAGTQKYMNWVNRADITLKQVLANILVIAKQRPVVIQSLFPMVDGEEPPDEEIEQYVKRLKELEAGGAQIKLVQVYSAHRPPHHPFCGHLPLKVLSRIAQRVRDGTGLNAEVF
jgi:wyosine [tRNA(Phe)-imidazoG37] synthetase (radical SAM superfamily)